MTTTTRSPKIGQSVVANGIRTNYLEAGSGDGTVVLIHGSGPGVTAYANWRLVLPALGEDFHVLAPDMVGFGYSDRPDDVEYNVQTWADQTVGFMDALGIKKAHLVGNSFGGAIALRIATQHPERVDQLVLMGSMGVDFPITEGLDAVWGYEANDREHARACWTSSRTRAIWSTTNWPRSATRPAWNPVSRSRSRRCSRRRGSVGSTR